MPQSRSPETSNSGMARAWQELARQTELPQDPCLIWLAESGLPGTEALAKGSAWTEADRIRFLQAVCGEER